jgi:voltage-gated potassium channel
MTTTTSSNDRLTRWEARGEWPLAAAAALFLAAYAWPILDTHLAQSWKTVCQVVDIAAWIAFVIDFVARLSLADRRRYYFSRHLLDLAVIALPILRPLRLLRLVMLLRVLNRGATTGLRGRIAIYVSGATVLLLFCAALAVLNSERGHAGANIHTFGDAIWWSATTITTVGYGDHFPVTTEGRFVATGLMLGGVALLGIITASIASWLIDKVRETEASLQAVTRDDVRALATEIQHLRAEIRVMTDSGNPRAAPGEQIPS